MDLWENLSPDFQMGMIILGIAGYLALALYANTVRRLLLDIAPENRLMAPGQAWLVLIPFFSIYWNFVIARRVADSLTNEFFDRKIAEVENPGLFQGILYAVIYLISHLPIFPLMSLFAVVYFVIYWVKISHFRSLISEHNQFVKRNET